MFYYQHNDKQNSYTNTGKAFLFKQSGFFFILYDSDRFSSWISEVVSLSAFTSVQSLVVVSFFLFLLKSPST
jgi:hypothetical protein